MGVIRPSFFMHLPEVMKIFLDTADTEQIKKYHGTGLIDGVTTNPTLIRKSGRDPEEVYQELQQLELVILQPETQDIINKHSSTVRG